MASVILLIPFFFVTLQAFDQFIKNLLDLGLGSLFFVGEINSKYDKLIVVKIITPILAFIFLAAYLWGMYVRRNSSILQLVTWLVVIWKILFSVIADTEVYINLQNEYFVQNPFDKSIILVSFLCGSSYLVASYFQARKYCSFQIKNGNLTNYLFREKYRDDLSSILNAILLSNKELNFEKPLDIVNLVSKNLANLTFLDRIKFRLAFFMLDFSPIFLAKNLKPFHQLKSASQIAIIHKINNQHGTKFYYSLKHIKHHIQQAMPNSLEYLK